MGAFGMVPWRCVCWPISFFVCGLGVGWYFWKVLYIKGIADDRGIM